MEVIRCGNCRKKLAEGTYTALAIKCPRCGALNQLRASSPPQERPGAPRPKGELNEGCNSKTITGAAPGG